MSIHFIGDRASREVTILWFLCNRLVHVRYSSMEIAMPRPVDKDLDKSLNIEFMLGCLVYTLNVHY